MATQSWQNTSGFLTINNISISFNNKSGILASTNQQQLFNLSAKNGCCQTWQEFSGLANANSLLGNGVSVPMLGSVLVLNPSLDFGLDDFLSASSLGQFNLLVTLNVSNQYDYSVQPELIVITASSGLFITEAGVSSTYLGILSKQAVLDAKAGSPAIDSGSYERLVGGRQSSRGVGNMLKSVHSLSKHSTPAMVGGGVVGGGRKGKLGKYL
jgi:hypothetical protein